MCHLWGAVKTLFLASVVVSLAAAHGATRRATVEHLVAFVISNDQINLTWEDTVGVVGYRVYRNGELVATVSTNAFKDSGLDPETTYTYTVETLDTASNVSAHLGMITATTSWDAGSSLNVAQYHSPQYDSSGKLTSWLIDEAGPFDTIMSLQANWWLNAPLVDGWPAYLTAAVLDRDYAQSNGALPGSASAMAIDAYLGYYAYSADARFLDMVKTIGDYTLQQALTPSTYEAYPSFPWPVGETGNITPDGSGVANNVAGEVMPDKGAMIGYALLKLYEATGDAQYLDEAVHIADVLAARAVTGTETQSPWPFRVMADTGEMIDGPLMGNQSFALRLYDELLRLGFTGNGNYQATRDNVWNWLKNIAIADTTGATWQHFFEDQEATCPNPTQFDALETARYLLEKQNAVDRRWFALAASIVNTVKANWVVYTGDYTAIAEQNNDMSAYNSHSARYASILALLYAAGGPAEYKDEAYGSLAYSAYSVDTYGFADTDYAQDNAWTTDSFGDWMKHFVTALGAVPEWAPDNASHLLSSTSVVQNVAYSDGTVHYTVFDPLGEEKLKLNFIPRQVQVEGVPVNTWTWDSAAQVIVIDHTTGGSVTVLAGTDVMPPAPRGASTT